MYAGQRGHKVRFEATEGLNKDIITQRICDIQVCLMAEGRLRGISVAGEARF